MKFKITKKNFIIFCVYCLLLLYFCAIAVLNFSSFSQDGTFYGLLPFKAFTSDYIGFTIGLFIAVLILIFIVTMVVCVLTQKISVLLVWIEIAAIWAGLMLLLIECLMMILA